MELERVLIMTITEFAQTGHKMRVYWDLVDHCSVDLDESTARYYQDCKTVDEFADAVNDADDYRDEQEFDYATQKATLWDKDGSVIAKDVDTDVAMLIISSRHDKD